MVCNKLMKAPDSALNLNVPSVSAFLLSLVLSERAETLHNRPRKPIPRRTPWAPVAPPQITAGATQGLRPAAEEEEDWEWEDLRTRPMRLLVEQYV